MVSHDGVEALGATGSQPIDQYRADQVPPPHVDPAGSGGCPFGGGDGRPRARPASNRPASGRRGSHSPGLSRHDHVPALRAHLHDGARRDYEGIEDDQARLELPVDVRVGVQGGRPGRCGLRWQRPAGQSTEDSPDRDGGGDEPHPGRRGLTGPARRSAPHWLARARLRPGPTRVGRPAHRPEPAPAGLGMAAAVE